MSADVTDAERAQTFELLQAARARVKRIAARLGILAGRLQDAEALLRKEHKATLCMSVDVKLVGRRGGITRPVRMCPPDDPCWWCQVDIYFATPIPAPPDPDGPPPELCTHPSFDDDGRCRTLSCRKVVATAAPKAFAEFNARMFADGDRTSSGPALCQSCVRERQALCTIVDVLAPCICCGEPTYGRNFER